MSDVKVTLVQMDIAWEDVDRNLAALDHKLASLNGRTDLVVLPEMFATGFSMDVANVAQEMDGRIVSWLRAQAERLNADVLGSAAIRVEEGFRNRLIWADPKGDVSFYDKKHLFRYGGEDKVYHPGSRNVLVNCRGWRMRPLICYDLRFPVWSRNFENQYDVLVYIANWPKRRREHWKALLKARAIENQCYVIGVNRVGQDGRGVDHSGDSAVIDPRGEVLFQRAVKEAVQTVSLTMSGLRAYREAFPAWKDADQDLVPSPP